MAKPNCKTLMESIQEKSGEVLSLSTEIKAAYAKVIASPQRNKAEIELARRLALGDPHALELQRNLGFRLQERPGEPARLIAPDIEELMAKLIERREVDPDFPSPVVRISRDGITEFAALDEHFDPRGANLVAEAHDPGVVWGQLLAKGKLPLDIGPMFFDHFLAHATEPPALQRALRLYYKKQQEIPLRERLTNKSSGFLVKVDESFSVDPASRDLQSPQDSRLKRGTILSEFLSIPTRQPAELPAMAPQFFALQPVRNHAQNSKYLRTLSDDDLSKSAKTFLNLFKLDLHGGAHKDVLTPNFLASESNLHALTELNLGAESPSAVPRSQNHDHRFVEMQTDSVMGRVEELRYLLKRFESPTAEARQKLRELLVDRLSRLQMASITANKLDLKPEDIAYDSLTGFVDPSSKTAKYFSAFQPEHSIYWDAFLAPEASHPEAFRAETQLGQDFDLLKEVLEMPLKKGERLPSSKITPLRKARALKVFARLEGWKGEAEKNWNKLGIPLIQKHFPILLKDPRFAPMMKKMKYETIRQTGFIHFFGEITGKPMDSNGNFWVTFVTYLYDSALDFPGLIANPDDVFARQLAIIRQEKTKPRDEYEKLLSEAIGELYKKVPAQNRAQFRDGVEKIHYSNLEQTNLANYQGEDGFENRLIANTYLRGAYALRLPALMVDHRFRQDELDFLGAGGVIGQVFDDVLDVAEDAAQGLVTVGTQKTFTPDELTVMTSNFKREGQRLVSNGTFKKAPTEDLMLLFDFFLEKGIKK